MKNLTQVLIIKILVTVNPTFVFAKANQCLTYLVQSAPAHTKFQIFKSRIADREMVYKYIPPSVSGAQTVVVIHGLGDSMTKVNKIIEQQKKLGYGVLAMDLHGHGRTLNQYLKEHDELPAEFDYFANVEDIRDLLRELRIDRVSLIGHSYGGGIAYALALELEKNRRIKVTSVHMLAPYVQRIDKFMGVYMQSAQRVIDEYSRWMTLSGIRSDAVGQIMLPLTRTVTALTSRLRYARALSRRALGINHTQDMIMDPAMIQFMHKAYKAYFVMLSGKTENELSERQLENIERKVEASIKVTIGIRGFDLLDPSMPMPLIKAPLQIIGAEHDQLVIPAQLNAFSGRLNEKGKEHEISFIKGTEVGHDFPQRKAAGMLKQIANFMNLALGKR